MWVFGYGSLVWKLGFPYEQKMVGYIKGFQRRFYQHSTDHRGTPNKPGRVVTLIPSQSEDVVWGIAYEIKEENVDDVISLLDHREKDGYKKMTMAFYPKDNQEPFQINVYIATTDNQNYAGEDSLENIAEQIARSVGPSGSNVDYVCNLAKAMRELCPEAMDEHLREVEARVLKLLK